MTFSVVGVNSGRETIGSKWIALHEVATSCPSLIEYVPIGQPEVSQRKLIRHVRRIDFSACAASHTINSSNVLHYSILRYEYIGAIRAQTLVRTSNGVIDSTSKIVVFDQEVVKNSTRRRFTVGVVGGDSSAPVMNKLLEVEYNGVWMPPYYVNYNEHTNRYVVFVNNTRIALLDFSRELPVEIYV